MTTTHLAREALTRLAQQYPEIWRHVDHLRAQRGHGLPTWPAWCWLPLSGAAAIYQRYVGTRTGPTEEIARIGALASWRTTQRIYRFDPDLYAALIATPLAGELPTALLYRLPDWCVYVETPGLSSTVAAAAHGRADPDPIVGAWAHLEWDAPSDGVRTELRLLLAFGAGRLVPAILHLGPWSVEQAVERAIAEAVRQAVQHGGPAALAQLDADAVRPLVDDLRPILSLVLYLCSERPDVSGRPWPPPRPEPTRTRHHGERWFGPPAPEPWDVGVRLGAALRHALAAAGEDRGGTHAAPRGHIRSAHWHTYWVGPRASAQRDTILRWLPPIPVNLDDPADLAATVRPVVEP